VLAAAAGTVHRAAIVRARGVSVRFGTVAALTNVDFEVRPGVVHALVGENGAGKSTLMRVLSGAVQPDEGALTLDGAAISFASPRDARRAGIRMIHQELSLVPGLSVADNIFLGVEPSTGGVLHRGRVRANARTVLAALGEDIDPDVRVEALSLAKREIVEIAKALAAPTVAAGPDHPSPDDPSADRGRSVDHPAIETGTLRVLILDEPTAILSSRETEALFSRLASLKRAGVGIVYCSHRLEEIALIADDVTVLRDGVCVAHGPAAEMNRKRMVALMVDRGGSLPATTMASPVMQPTGPDALRVEGLETAGVHHATLTVRGGEIVGLVGLVGAGRTELARAIVGADRRWRGDVFIDGQRVDLSSPRDAARSGVVYVSEDRKAGGLIPDGSVLLNLTLARLRSFARRPAWPVIDRMRERAVADKWVEALRIKIRDLDQSVSRLSGGNQQKIVLARWMIREGKPLRVLIVDEPTRGVDAAARADIHVVLRQIASSGTAVLAITSDLEEAFAVADRLLVMREGRIAGASLVADATPARIAALMVPE
jgi:ribose transport system ATP-binding protein